MSISQNVIKVSKFISQIFNPLFSLLFYFFYVQIKHESLSDVLQNFLILFALLILPILIWIYARVKKGKYTDADVSDRVQRKSLYWFIIAFILVYILINHFIYNTWNTVMLFLLILMIALQLSNLFIKSSMHTALNIYVAALFFSQNYKLGIIWLLVSVIVAVTRIISKRHSPKEVFSGAAIAIIISFIYLYTNIQIQH